MARLHPIAIVTSPMATGRVRRHHHHWIAMFDDDNDDVDNALFVHPQNIRPHFVVADANHHPDSMRPQCYMVDTLLSW